MLGIDSMNLPRSDMISGKICQVSGYDLDKARQLRLEQRLV